MIFRISSSSYLHFYMAEQLFQLSNLQNFLHGKLEDWEWHVVEETESTNSDLKHLPASVLTNPFVLIADAQTAGRGQYERTWTANAYQNIFCSVALVTKRKKGIQLIGLIVAVAIAESIQELFPDLKPKIKWPNDVILHDKKVAGILIETQFMGSELEKVVIGFGVNVNQTEFSDDLVTNATSLELESNQKINREELLAKILLNLNQLINYWEEGDSSVLASIHNRLVGFESYVRVKTVHQVVKVEKAWLLGLDFNGRLGILCADNKEHWFEHEQIRLELH